MDTFSSGSFKWHKGRGTSTLGELGISSFPKRELFIRSERTGKVQKFLVDGAVMERNEFFDGEATAYLAVDDSATIQIWC